MCASLADLKIGRFQRKRIACILTLEHDYTHNRYTQGGITQHNRKRYLTPPVLLVSSVCDIIVEK